MCWSSCAWGGWSPGQRFRLPTVAECIARGVEQGLAGSARGGKGVARGLKRDSDTGTATRANSTRVRVGSSAARRQNETGRLSPGRRKGRAIHPRPKASTWEINEQGWHRERRALRDLSSQVPPSAAKTLKKMTEATIRRMCGAPERARIRTEKAGAPR